MGRGIPSQPTRESRVSGSVVSSPAGSSISVNFCKAARLEPPHFSNSKASRLLIEPRTFATCDAYYEAVFCDVPNKK